ncbi:MAG TPA: hypothetical protein VNO31_28140 [Umezawaea sp.]|jgi:hypothetical protein|nr:hypothetical protein [Umezawaea sp.]
MSEHVTLHWILTHKTESQIRAEEESAGRLAAALAQPVRRARRALIRAVRRS